MPVSVHRLVTTDDFLPILDGYPTKFPAGERFSYCNGGFVVLALIAERVAGRSYHDLVRELVCSPAGMTDTDFLRSDALPGTAALGYVEVDGQWRTNVFHLPVVATGDGGAYTTTADMSRFWEALMGGRIVTRGDPRRHAPAAQRARRRGVRLLRTGVLGEAPTHPRSPCPVATRASRSGPATTLSAARPPPSSATPWAGPGRSPRSSTPSSGFRLASSHLTTDRLEP